MITEQGLPLQQGRRTTMPRIFVCGDTHFPHDHAKLNTRNFPEQKTLNKSDVVIILGDFGLLWTKTPDNEEIWWTRNLTERRFTTLFLDGNHENYERLANLPVEERFGAPVGVISESIFYLKRGCLYTIGETRLFVMGGAASTDKEFRVAYESWWPEEIPSEGEMQRAMKTITDCGGSVDYVLTHTCPRRILPPVLSKVRERCQGNPSPTAKAHSLLVPRFLSALFLSRRPPRDDSGPHVVAGSQSSDSNVKSSNASS